MCDARVIRVQSIAENYSHKEEKQKDRVFETEKND